ncbi:RES family NAD+ phosphorylase [Rhizobium sp. SL86]|uniref:RES family NAD+ phosphorylase n=1 Tax=Rhizobium sp. SL86 TaxID=2995148 RepID=UPI00227607F0|nr:RES family NAD+ phosphorylase [Rhizobium sp. SL86]MCY1668068.1 RES family NAD+ phosphorylase [Rhizobium sp. SL86]
METFKDDPERMKAAINRGGKSDLRSACDSAERIVSAVAKAGDEETLKTGFKAFRARNDYIVFDDPESGRIEICPLAGKDLGAPPKEKTSLGRFNPPNQPVLYLSTSMEVCLAEVRALSSDTCTVATFQTVRPIRLAKLLKLGTPLGVFLSKEPTDEDRDKWLLSQTAKFVSRRVPDSDRELHYRTCNLIASAFLESGFDGLVYRTSFWSPGWREKNDRPHEDHVRAANIVLFDPDAATPQASAVYSINWKRPYAEQASSSVWTANT